MSYTLEIKTLEADQYYDQDTILLHACFQVLDNFIRGEITEREDLVNAWEEESRVDENERRLINLLHWWRVRRAVQQEVYDEHAMYLFETEKLIELMLSRKGMWT